MPRRSSLGLGTSESPAAGVFFKLDEGTVNPPADQIELIETFNWKPQPISKSRKPIYGRYDKDTVTKMTAEFDFALRLRDTTGGSIDSVKSALHLTTLTTVFGVGGTSRALKGDLQKGSLSIETKNKEASAHYDVWRSPQALGTSIAFQGDFFINDSGGVTDGWAPKLMSSIIAVGDGSASAGVKVLDGPYSLDFGGQNAALTAGAAITGSCQLTDAPYQVNTGDFITYGMSWKGQGLPTINSTSHWLLKAILTGSATLGYSVATPGASFTAVGLGNQALITRANISFENEELYSIQGSAVCLTYPATVA